ncbi:MAG TPA: DUF1987 domain-containing protein [Salinivirgaceae bacterium]|nr:DUF1987 domain-containing protein [Salinivirgaceae bacterium]
MYPLVFEGNSVKPKVILDKKSGEFIFSGVSMCEDALAFYKPIFDWIKQYALDPNPKTEVHFKLTYFNTASSKMILDVMLRFEEIYNMGNDVCIFWHYPPDDEDLEEAGEIYKSRLEIPFNVIENEDD